MASIAAIFLGCCDTFKSILASQDFGNEYELLCTELSIQSLRVRLWGESVGRLKQFHKVSTNFSKVGLDAEETARPLKQTFNRREIEKTVTQTIHSVAHILSEIEILRKKYDLKPSASGEADKNVRSWKSFGSLFVASQNPSVLQQRMQENQKQKSFIAIAKWASVDAKKFEEKIRALKSLIDGLESISKAAGVPVSSPTAPSNSVSVSDDPPPYSARPRARRSATEGAVPLQPTPHQTSDVITASKRENYYTIMKKYLAGCPNSPALIRKSRDKLSRLSEEQMGELIIDIYHDLLRRQQPRDILPHLPEVPAFHPKRNQARKKFGTLSESRFHDLVSDLVTELEKRYPILLVQDNRSSDSSELQHSTVPKLLNRSSTSAASPSHSRSRSAASRTTPPAPLIRQHSDPKPTTNTNRALPLSPLARPHSSQKATNTKEPRPLSPKQSASKPTTANNKPLPAQNPTLVKPSPPASPSGPDTVSMEVLKSFKSFRVTLTDPTSRILPAALKRYGIDAPWEEYSLYLSSGGKERCLRLDEKPLIVFKELSEKGGKPMFMLKKIEN